MSNYPDDWGTYYHSCGCHAAWGCDCNEPEIIPIDLTVTREEILKEQEEEDQEEVEYYGVFKALARKMLKDFKGEFFEELKSKVHEHYHETHFDIACEIIERECSDKINLKTDPIGEEFSVEFKIELEIDHD